MVPGPQRLLRMDKRARQKDRQFDEWHLRKEKMVKQKTARSTRKRKTTGAAMRRLMIWMSKTGNCCMSSYRMRSTVARLRLLSPTLEIKAVARQQAIATTAATEAFKSQIKGNRRRV